MMPVWNTEVGRFTPIHLALQSDCDESIQLNCSMLSAQVRPDS